MAVRLPLPKSGSESCNVHAKLILLLKMCYHYIICHLFTDFRFPWQPIYARPLATPKGIPEANTTISMQVNLVKCQ